VIYSIISNNMGVSVWEAGYGLCLARCKRLFGHVPNHFFAIN